MSNVISLFTRRPVEEAGVFAASYEVVGDFSRRPRASDILLVEVVLPAAMTTSVRALLDRLTAASAEAWARRLVVVSLDAAPDAPSDIRPFSHDTEFNHQPAGAGHRRNFATADGLVLMEGYLSRACVLSLAHEFAKLGVRRRADLEIAS